MSRRAEHPRGRASAPVRAPLPVLLLGLLLALLTGCLSACSLLDGDDRAGASPTTSAAPPPPGVVDELKRVLRRRAVAVREGEEARFRSGLVRRDDDFAAAQADYFGTMQQLPVQVFRYGFDPADILRVEDSYWVVVEVHLQLEGYDAAPVVTRDRYLFAPGGRGRLRLASVTDPAWEERNAVLSQPWDRGPVEVRSVEGVLGVFDAGSVAAADGVLASVQRGLGEVRAVVPYDWDDRVVVYAFSDTAFLASLEQLPGGDPDQVDGVAFPVPLDDTDPAAGAAGVRIVLHPRMLTRTDDARDRLVRHELTHVALGPRDDHFPAWLSEGLAEWVSVAPMAPEDRALSTESLEAARAGLAAGDLDLPPSDGFNGASSGAHYGLSWWACEVLATTYGEGVLWDLVDRLDAEAAEGDGASGTSLAEIDARGDDALRRLTGLTSAELARRAAKLVVTTYGP